MGVFLNSFKTVCGLQQSVIVLGRRAVLAPCKGSAKMLMGIELGLFFCSGVGQLRGCWELIVSECGAKTAEGNIKI